MNEGYVYILMNPSLDPKLLKIGMTTRLPEIRAKEVSQGSGVPSEYKVAYELKVDNCEKAERVVHERLKKHRVNDNREFFNISLKEAIKIVEEVGQAVDSESAEDILRDANKILAAMDDLDWNVNIEARKQTFKFFFDAVKLNDQSPEIIMGTGLSALYCVVDQEANEANQVLEQFSHEMFDRIIAGYGLDSAFIKLGNKLYLLPHHAYVNKAMLYAIQRNIREAEQLCQIIETRLLDKVLDDKEFIRNELYSSLEGIKKLIKKAI